jgi:hypothetical protein
VRHTYDCIDIYKGSLKKLVCEDAACIVKAKETVVREDRSDSHQMRVHDSLVTKTRETGVSVYQPDVFSKNDGAQVGEKREEIGQGCGGCNGKEWDIVDFERGEEIAYSYAIWRMTVSDHNNL